MAAERVKTYVRGFDEKMNGGVPKGHVILVVGEPGSMKSSFVYSILYNAAKQEGAQSVYVTLEQSRESLLNHMEGMDFNTVVVEDKVTVVDLALIRKNLDKLGQQTWMQIFKMYAQNLKKTVDFQLFAIDSLPVLELLAEFDNPRNELFHFFEWLRDLGVTTFIISELRSSSVDYGLYGEDFLADGIIHLKMENVDGINIQRRVRCVKMRNTNHSTNYYTLIFDGGRFQATRVLSDNVDY